MISSSFGGWGGYFDFWRDSGRRLRSENRFDLFDEVNLQSKPNWLRILIIILWILRGAAVGAAAAELSDRAFDGAVHSGFLAVEAVQEPTGDGITSRYEGEAADVVKVAIPVVMPDKFLVFVF